MFEPPYRTKNMMPGMIMLWYGSVASIPSGWTLCDGTLGTPDLRGKFVRGAGGTYTPGTIGGTSTHTHTFITAGHRHDLAADVYIDDVSPSGDLNHQTTISQDTGTTYMGYHLPPFYTLCYIMKL